CADDAYRKQVKQWGAVVIVCGITLYFFWQNLKGIHESSDKALKIMVLTTVMAVIMLGWCCVTLAVNGPANGGLPTWQPDLAPKIQPPETPHPATPSEPWVKDPAPGKPLPKPAQKGRPLPQTKTAAHEI